MVASKLAGPIAERNPIPNAAGGTFMAAVPLRIVPWAEALLCMSAGTTIPENVSPQFPSLRYFISVDQWVVSERVGCLGAFDAIACGLGSAVNAINRCSLTECGAMPCASAHDQRWALKLFVPYVAWVAFATLLNASLWALT